MSDYKWDIQMLAEEIAENEHGKEFCSLTNDEQYKVYSRAMETWSERAVDNVCI